MTSTLAVPPDVASHRARGRPFAWLWASFGASCLADGIYQVALPVTAVHFGAGPGTVALVLMASRAPWLIVSLPAGVLVDRVGRRLLLLAVSGARFSLLAGVTVLLTADVGSNWLLVALAFLMGTAETVFDTALHSTTPRVVHTGDMEKANSRLQATETVASQFAGPSVGGAIVGLAVAVAFGATAVLCLATVVAVSGLRIRPATAAGPAWERVGPAVRSGLTALWRDKTLLTYSIGGCAINCAFAAFFAALPVVALAAGPLHVSAAGYGLMLATAGLGGLATSAVTSALVRRLGARRCIAFAATVLAAGFAMPGIVPRPAAVVVGLVATGAVVLTSVVTVSYRQRAVPDHLLGRVTAAYRMIAFGGLPLGSALAGVIGTVKTPYAVFPVAGVLVVGAGAAMALATPRKGLST
jgi:MFS family permease